MDWKISSHLREQIYYKTNGHCWYCGKKLTMRVLGDNSKDSIEFRIDHIVPRSRGGSHEENNLVPCCVSCNSQKKDKTLEEYRYSLSWKRAGVKPFDERQLYYLEVECGLTVPFPPSPTFWFEQEEESSDG